MLSSRLGRCVVAGGFLALGACSRRPDTSSTTETRAATRPAEASQRAAASRAPACQLIENGFGPKGSAAVRVETVATGLEVPWSIAFLPGGDMLVTERPGRIRLVRNGTLVSQPVATLPVSQKDESGLLGLAVHPRFSQVSLIASITARRRAACNRTGFIFKRSLFVLSQLFSSGR